MPIRDLLSSVASTMSLKALHGGGDRDAPSAMQIARVSRTRGKPCSRRRRESRFSRPFSGETRKLASDDLANDLPDLAASFPGTFVPVRRWSGGRSLSRLNTSNRYSYHRPPLGRGHVQSSPTTATGRPAGRGEGMNEDQRSKSCF